MNRAAHFLTRLPKPVIILCAFIWCMGIGLSVTVAYTKADFLIESKYIDKENACDDAVDPHEGMVCFAEILEVEEKRLKDINSKLLEFFNSFDYEYEEDIIKNKEIIDLYKKSHKKWEEYVNMFCSEFMHKRYFPGSLYKTEILRCRYILNKDRIKNLNEFFKRQLKYLYSETD